MGRTIVALYDRADDARRAVEDLTRAGVPRDDTDVGQPGTSPGTRGGATAFGGIEREKPRTQSSPGVGEKSQSG